MRSKNRSSGKQERTFIEQARRSQLVDCAIAAIVDVGLPRASLAEIARRAGITKQAIFYHFSSREELIHEVVATVTNRGAEFMAARWRHQPSPVDELTAYIEANVEYIATYRDQVRALVVIAMNFTDEDGRSRLALDASVYGDSLAPLQDILRRGQEQGHFDEFNTRTAAVTIRAAIDAIGPQLSVIPDLDLGDYARDLVALFHRATAGNRT
ncbi:TetR/AcrR family transcriptional regulator [Streptomyces sp. RGM 3693]|uniref:TetR/AcrR family transcriptional regulator n=1 Tax=Streptomyces sp. RGM 3693 TaxID=3413284 RepID=UPI003D26F90A